MNFLCIPARRLSIAAPLVLSSLLLVGCGEGDPVRITEVREHTLPAPPSRDFDFDLPEGWMPAKPDPGTIATLLAPRETMGKATLVRLGGAGGGLLANVNRWRGQMGLAPVASLDEAELGEIEIPGLRQGQLGRTLEVTGTFTSRGGGTMAGAALLAVAVPDGNQTLFWKLLCQAKDLDALRAPFLGMVRSTRPGSGETAPGAEQQPSGANPAGSGDPRPANTSESSGPGPASHRGFAWTTPAGWSWTPGNSIRLATFAPDGTQGTRLSVTVLGGTAGGERSNLDRWRGELRLKPLSDEELAALPRVPILGTEAVLMDAKGSSWSGTGNQPISGPARMIAAIVPVEGRGVLFIKLTGPQEEVTDQHRKDVEALLRSLKRGEG